MDAWVHGCMGVWMMGVYVLDARAYMLYVYACMCVFTPKAQPT